MPFPFLKSKYRNLHEESEKTLIIKNPDLALVEAFKSTRINLMYTLSNEEEGGKTVMLTSAFSGEGKTTTCLNLAATFAQTESKVIIIDSDLRRPRLHTYLDVKNKIGLANHLGGFATLEEILQRAKNHNFDFITAGDLPPNPTELLASSKFTTFIDRLKESYDYIIFDTPPANVVADVQSMVPAIKNVVFVCRCGVSVTAEVQKAVASLEFSKAKILGFITIDSREKKADYYDSYSFYYDQK